MWTYLKNRRPAALLTDRLRLSASSLTARRLSLFPTRIALTFHSPISVKLEKLPTSRARTFKKKIRKWAPRNDKLIAISNGIREELITRLKVSPNSIDVVFNPVVTPEMTDLAKEPVEESFFDTGVPVLITAGRMTEPKDFETLLRAFRIVKDQMPCHLLILGEHGKQYERLMLLVKDLGLAKDVTFPGFKKNPYKYIARSSVFVLSSKWEGFGNVLVEALALGVPVVSTDCPIGPREILEHGRLGKLVPVGNAPKMASAIIETLNQPPDMKLAKRTMERYTVDRSTDGYLKALGLLDQGLK
ncbi:MAG: glycosyltransferase [Deltaproteobacteria bacterium]|nr:MAG: glycosyltransferase [Deltaproteobacteria bacterium]